MLRAKPAVRTGTCVEQVVVNIPNVILLSESWWATAWLRRVSAFARSAGFDRWMLAVLLSCSLIPFFSQAQTGTATVAIQADQPGAAVSSNLFGIFFEEINFAGEGGLYAEQVRNRGFDSSTNPDYWTLVTQGSAAGQMVVDTSLPLNTNNLRALKLTMQSGAGTVGAANSGFWGIPLQSGSNYDLSFYARASNGFSGPVSVRLESANGATPYAQALFSGLTPNWQRFGATLTPTASDPTARLVVSVAQPATVWLDVVSLFPRGTFHQRTNGLRADVANLLAAARPSFMRYPGGNFIESNTVTNAVRWKTTVGDIAARPGHLNDAWGYWSTDGFGLHEYLLFCEDLGMEPLYGINCGLMLGYNGSPNNTVPLDQMGPWVQDALDLIQYANGDTNTTWGALRAAHGHPAPFNLKYLEIGNENGGSYYNDRYALFYDAIRSNNPAIHLVACDWGGIPWSRPVEIQDEHYYASAATFISYFNKYDSYSRSGPKVFVGEYAVTSGYGTLGNLSAALGEATFMTGMERNADVVLLASYAPLLANVNGIQWHPDLIYYDGTRVTGTPSYYVQQMFGQNRGDMTLPTTATVTSTATNPLPHGAIGLGSWNTSVQYTNVVVTSNGVTLYQSDFAGAGTNGWRVYNGTWSASGGRYQQTALLTDCRSTTGNTNWANYTITLRARKVSGSEGFLILFNWLDDNNWTWWNIGGWNNTLDGLEQNVNGTKSLVGAQVSQTITNNGWYDVAIVLSAQRIQCSLNGQLIEDVTYPSNAAAGLYASSTYDKARGELVIKAVNPYSTALATTFNLAGVSGLASSGTLIQLTSSNPSDENSLANPQNVAPATSVVTSVSTNLALTLPANSLSILRLPSTLSTYTNLQLAVASPLNVGQVVPAALWGWKTGQGTPVDLTTNPNHAITWTSGDTGVAGVDAVGQVTGVGPGSTFIEASYAGLGLVVTQTVQVVGQRRALVHRYSFSETSGSTAADSVGGPAWNGSLPSGGTFGNGLLSLAAAGKQYLQLPAGILSNYAAVTIETWTTFPTQLPVNCFFFGFGNISGASGVNYIFCAPLAGRIAITPSDYSGEQNAYSGVDFSFHTNFHVVAIFNPPAGYLALYTNGVLAGINTAVTVPLTSVNDVYSYVARSLYSNDPYPDLVLDEFRIYSGALSANEIAATQLLGPGQLLSAASPTLGFTVAGGSLLLTWPLNAAGFTLLSATNLTSGGWTPVSTPAQISGGQWQVVLPLAAQPEFFRLQQ